MCCPLVDLLDLNNVIISYYGTMGKSCKASTRSQIGLGLIETLPETDENNSL